MEPSAPMVASLTVASRVTGQSVFGRERTAHLCVDKYDRSASPGALLRWLPAQGALTAFKDVVTVVSVLENAANAAVQFVTALFDGARTA